jgi:ribokinase
MATPGHPRIVVVGSTMMDMIAYTDRFPAAGETIHGRSFSLGFGGKGANQAVMCSLLGADVSMVACVGTDLFGDLTLENFRDFSVRTQGIRRIAEVSSGVAPIWVDGDGTNKIIIVGGANDEMSITDVDEGLRIAGTADALVCQLEIPVECVERAFVRARSMGAIAILNPAPMVPVDAGVLRLADWIIPNESELEELGRLTLGEVDGDLETLAGLLAAELGVGLVVTLGARGALLCQPGHTEALLVESRDVEATDTTGAGDAFVGSFAYALARSVNPETAAQFACGCAASSVTRRGTQSSFPRDTEVDELEAIYLAGIEGLVKESPEEEVKA